MAIASRRFMAAPSQPALRESHETTTSFSAVKLQDDPKPAPEEPKTPFEKLPTEMIHEIGLYLQDDQDLEDFRCLCKAVNKAIDDGNGYFWRRRLVNKFAKPRAESHIKSGADCKIAYRQRRHVLSTKVEIKRGEDCDEQKCLKVLRDIILDSYSGMTEENKVVYNPTLHQILRDYCHTQNIIREMFDQKWTFQKDGRVMNYKKGDPLLQTIQVMLAPVILSRAHWKWKGYTLCFPQSQVIAYANPPDRPIFTGLNGLEVDMDWTLHQINFWKYHMLREEEGTLYSAYHNLEPGEEPSFHTSALTDSKPAFIGKHWKGAYGFVHHDDILTLRDDGNGDQQIQDEFNSDEDMNELQDMTLEATVEGDETWPGMFEEMLGSLKEPVSTARTRAQRRSSPPEIYFRRPRSMRFSGTGADQAEDFHADGWLNQLPPQNGIPGWQRVTMMKYYVDEFGSLDLASLWAYEGVVLPGGKTIIGRWWSPNTTLVNGEIYSGPFILWCTDDAHPQAVVGKQSSAAPEVSS